MRKFLRSTIICTALFAVPTAMAQTITPDMMQGMPTKAEMRQQMLDAGMTPQQVEDALASIPFPESSPADNGNPADPVCADENANNVCDDEENDPVITECRKSYLDRLTAYTLDTHGSDLGRNTVEIAQTCSTAAVGGTAYFGQPPGAMPTAGGRPAWYMDMATMEPIKNYWDSIILYYSYIVDPDYIALDIESMDLDDAIDRLPPDLQTMVRIPDGSEDPTQILHERSAPIHAKCEDIREAVGEAYAVQEEQLRVCLTHIPQLTDNSGEN